ncbi:hypothetical protein SISNIDRAFT_484451 [Sistotremastrum niveocremeum HHB9708]|uniref:F-box domain-containing protein n=1 Tax=Sistotremastrum niveocremeum HHB9708 TaxID=1314777 RepID=A0A164WCK3_9AGAM|nr:hypothetical protein SISNIDRAFT_484451 [Sistotremastrum niveocremeum HHB9708]
MDTETVVSPPSESAKLFWNTPELLVMTFRHMRRADQARCAGLNKYSSEHALDAIYRDNPPLENLLALLSPLAAVPRTGQPNSVEWKFTKALRVADWDRFRHYSFRVRSLVKTIESFVLSQESMLDLFTTMPPGVAFLPCLTNLCWEEVDPSTMSFVITLFNSKLKEVELTLAEAPIDSRILLEQLSRRSPELESLQFWTTDAEVNDSLALSGLVEAVRSLPSLRSLELCAPMFNSPLLQQLSQTNRRLKRLWFFIYGPDASKMCSDDKEDRSAESFSELRDVSIPSSGLTTLFGRHVEGYQLTFLHVAVDDDMTALRDNLSVVATSCSNLKHLSIMHHINHPEASAAALSMEMVTPLLALKSLQVLVIDHSEPPNLSNQDLQQISASFPELQHFELCVRARGRPKPISPTLECLIPFAQNCKKLISIGIFMDTSISPPLLRLNEIMFPPNFSAMHVQYSKIIDHISVVDFLISIFPAHASLTISPYSPHLRYVSGPMALNFPGAMRQVDEESAKSLQEWGRASRLLAGLSRARDLLDLRRQWSPETS